MAKQILDEDYSSIKNDTQLPNTVSNDIYDHTNETKNTQLDFPTEVVDLPSKGLCYPENNPLSLGKVELKYPTTAEEDILTSANLISKGLVYDKFLQSIIVSNINYNDLLIGDKNALLVAARILAYGPDYEVKYQCPGCKETNEEVHINLTSFEDKVIDFNKLNRNNEYEYQLPASKANITFKLLTVNDDKNIEQELKGLKKIQETSKNKNIIDKELSTRMKYIITSVNGNRDITYIRQFVDKMLTRDTKDFRLYMNSITPNIVMKFKFECEHCEYEAEERMPMTVQFFWPNSEK